MYSAAVEGAHRVAVVEDGDAVTLAQQPLGKVEAEEGVAALLCVDDEHPLRPHHARSAAGRGHGPRGAAAADAAAGEEGGGARHGVPVGWAGVLGGGKCNWGCGGIWVDAADCVCEGDAVSCLSSSGASEQLDLLRWMTVR